MKIGQVVDREGELLVDGSGEMRLEAFQGGGHQDGIKHFGRRGVEHSSKILHTAEDVGGRGVGKGTSTQESEEPEQDPTEDWEVLSPIIASEADIGVQMGDFVSPCAGGKTPFSQGAALHPKAPPTVSVS